MPACCYGGLALPAPAHDGTCWLHGSWFRHSAERLDSVDDAGMAFFTMLSVVFSVVPPVALLVTR